MAIVRCVAAILAIMAVAMAGDAPEDAFSEKLFESLGKNAELVVDYLTIAAPEQRPRLFDMLHNIQADPDKSAECVGCQIIFSILGYLVKMGHTVKDDIGPPAVRICKVLTTIITNSRDPGDKLCQSIVDNYGQHVENILKYNRLLPEESCYFINMCTNDEESFEMPPVGDIIGIIVPILPLTTPKWFPIRPKEPKSHRILPMIPQRFNRDTRRQRNWQEDENILRVAQFTDIHVDELYAEGGPTECGLFLCCRDMPDGWRPDRGSAREYGEYRCNVPPKTTRLFLDKAKALNPHIVLYSGDSPPHHIWEETLAWQMNVTTNVGLEFTKYFTGIPTYSAIGNHECFPTNMYYPKHEHTQVLHETFIAAYGSLGNFQPEQLETIRHAGYYTSLVRPGLRILTLNTNFGYTSNWYNLLHVHGTEYKIMMDWADQVLTNAAASDEKVMVLSHHPCGSNVKGFDQNMTNLMVAHADVIILNVVGHNHKDEFRIFSDTSGTPKGVQFLSQSSNSYDGVNPGVRMYYFDNTTLELLGYEQYYMSIQLQAGSVEVKLLYKTDEDYDLANLNAESMMDFAIRMQTDDALFDAFCNNRVTGAPHGTCNRETLLCRQMTSTQKQYEQCTGQTDTTSSTPTTTTTTTTISSTTPGSASCTTFSTLLLALAGLMWLA